MKSPTPRRGIRLTRRAPHKNNEPPKTIRESDFRIASAIKTLQAHDRGRRVLGHFKTFANSDTNGLDLSGQAALVTLVKELTFGGRRDFLAKIEASDFELGRLAAIDAFCKGMNPDYFIRSTHHDVAVELRKESETHDVTMNYVDGYIYGMLKMKWEGETK